MTVDAASAPLPRASAVRRSGWRLRAGHALYRLATRLHWAEPELNGLRAVVRPGDAVLDIGAALGMYTVPLADIVGRDGRVFAFEPQRRGVLTVRLLRVLTGARQGTTRRVALGPNAGDGHIAVPFRRGFPIFGHGHIAEGADDGQHRLHQSRTHIDTVDAWCAAHGIDRVAFIKVDVEGFEPSVIEGARRIIDRDRPSLLLEIEDRHLVRYGRDAAGFLAELHERWPEYRMHTWDGAHWIETGTVDPATRNYLFATEAALAG
ncbi:FkbM family methyltransferase [Pseudolysinimonas kribbensis]|uniref:Methyltransferase n=1 Tax=Pseudolysinimonas kribbensis TaxID=433641 RepID=A0ABQ6K624_9MICO|nr:FkbM family methyltransferase [Pseudolysinimonas kribbensis]GMA94292.1 putative methyltransferase [Pseudolysinimonas kribbensis]